MSLDFVKQIENVGRRIERRRWFAAVCWGFAAMVAAATALAALDWLLGVDHPAARLALTGLLLTVLAFVVLYFRRVIQCRVKPLDVALELERQRPELYSLLASGVEFSQQDDGDATAGSADLRRAVVVRAAAAAESIDLSAATPLTPLRRAIAAALVAAAMLALAFALMPAGAAIGVARLANPLGEHQWPRDHDLAFDDPPTRLAQGGDFQTMLRDRRGQLPASIEVEYRVRRGGRWHYQSQTYVSQGDAIKVRWPNVQSSFEFRARGGDDASMAWRRVETEAAPQVESLRLVARPPAYSGLTALPLEEPAAVLQESSIELVGRTSAPIAAGELRAAGEAAVQLEIVDGREFRVAAGAWQPQASAAWALRFTTPNGLVATADRRITVEVTPDRPPTASITAPTTDVAVLPESILDLSIEAHDDVGLRSIGFTATQVSGGDGQPTATELWTAPSYDPAELQPTERTQQVRHAFALTSVGAAPGTSWELSATASDAAGQVAEVLRPMRIRVITREEFLRHVDGELALIVAALEHVQSEQCDVRQRVAAWQTGKAEERPTSERALAALARQREVAARLDGSADAALPMAKALGAEYACNQFAGDAASRLATLAVELESLTASTLPAIEVRLSEFTRTRSTLPSNSELQSPDRDVLAATLAAQDHVLASLTTWIVVFSRWSDAQRFRRQIAEIQAEQFTIAEQTSALGRDAFEAEPNALTAERERAKRAVVDAQRELAARFASALAGMAEAAASLAAADPDEAAKQAAAVQFAESVQAQLRAAAEHLASSRFGQASESQRRVSESLNQMLERLASGATPQAAVERLKKLAIVERQLETLRRQTQQLIATRRAASDTEKQPRPGLVGAAAEQALRELERLELHRRELAQQSEEIAKRLNQLHAAPPAESVRRAAEQLRQPDGGEKTAEQAERDLAEAQRQLAAEQRQQQSLLARQKMEQLDAVLRRLVASQQAVVDEIRRLDGLRSRAGGLTPAQRASVAALPDRQAAVREQSASEANEIAEFPIFARLLRAAADTMKHAEAKFAEGSTGEPAQQPAVEALRELRLLADAVRQHRQQPPSPKPNDQQPAEPKQGGDQNPSDSAQVEALQLAVAQLGLLRTLQAELEGRTAAMERVFGAGRLNERSFPELSKKLADEQRELSELAETLVRETQLPADDDLQPNLDEELQKSLDGAAEAPGDDEGT